MSEFCAKPHRASPKDEGLSAIALGQWGVASVGQLYRAGLDKDTILHRVRVRRLHRVHRGVYAIGHLALAQQGRWMAAVLAHGGPYESFEAGMDQSTLEYWGAAISHRSAAELWELLSPADGPIDVSVFGDSGKRKRRGIRVPRSLTLLSAHVTLRDGIPVTTPARTIADLRRVVSRRGRPGPISAWELRRAIRQAEVLGLPLGDEVESDGTRSDLESDFLGLCRRRRLPAPEVNVRAGPHLVDFLWRER